MQIDIKKMSVTELKALGYEQLIILQSTQQNIAIIQQEINSRVLPEKQLPVENTEKL